jgi:hypothetical protein
MNTLHTQEQVQPGIADERYADREASFGTIEPGAPRLLVCADERPMSAASRARIEVHYGLPPESRYNRDFGGIHGASHDAAIALVAQAGTTAVIQPFAGNYKGFTGQIKELYAAENEGGQAEGRGAVLPLDHSDDHKEGNAAELNSGAEEGLGCAFDLKFGAIFDIEANNTEVQDEGREEYTRTVDPDPAVYDMVVDSAKQVLEVLINGNVNYSVSRADAAALADKDAGGKPLAPILEGEHAKVDDVAEIADYVPNSGAEPDMTHPAFVTNVTDTSLQLARALKRGGFQVNPELLPKILFATKILKRAAVRFALSGGQARRMATTSRGDAQQGLAYIQQQLAASRAE